MLVVVALVLVVVDVEVEPAPPVPVLALDDVLDDEVTVEDVAEELALAPRSRSSPEQAAINAGKNAQNSAERRRTRAA